MAMSLTSDIRKTREGSFGWMLQRLARRVEARLAEKLRALDLSILQFAIMMTVLERPAQTQAAIGQGFDVPAYAISRALDGLEARGLVERRMAAASRRSFEVHVTAAGQALAPQLRAIVQEVNTGVTQGLTAAETDHLLGLMARLLADTE